MSKDDTFDKRAYYSEQYDARAMISDHARVFTRWQKASAHVRRSQAALLDIAYGESPGERLDFFPARQAGSPVLVFIHGGWWRSLDKSDFSFIAAPFTRAGFNVVLTNYTLAPEASIEAIVCQQLRALAWVYRNADAYDADPRQLVVAGHSAGAHLAAMMMAAQWPRYAADLPEDLIKAGILLSGLYDLEPLPFADFVNADLKLDKAAAQRLSPAWLPLSRPIPFITAAGGLESDEFKRQNALIGQVWSASHRSDIPLPTANHLTICDDLCDEAGALFQNSASLARNLV